MVAVMAAAGCRTVVMHDGSKDERSEPHVHDVAYQVADVPICSAVWKDR